MTSEEWQKARDAAYSFETLSHKIAQATTEDALGFIAEQAKTAREHDKPRLRKLWLERLAEIQKGGQ